MASFSLTVNNKTHTVDTSHDQPLLWVLRDILGLTGTKYGCGISQCWACCVLVNGEAKKACVYKVEEAVGKTITTIEGLGANGLHPLQQAWIDEQVPQCGFCQPGILMATAAKLASDPNARNVSLNNICACGTYNYVRRAINRVTGAASGSSGWPAKASGSGGRP